MKTLLKNVLLRITIPFGVLPIVANGQTPVEWVAPGAGNWTIPSNWAGGNIPDQSNEQARHTLGLGGQVTIPSNYVRTIHSFVGTAGVYPRNLRLQSGSFLTVGSVTNPTPGNGSYRLLLNPGARMSVTGATSAGLTWDIENSAVLDVAVVNGGTWRIGTSGQINNSVARVSGGIQNADCRILLGASLGTASTPVASISNSTIRFGEDSQSNGGGNLYVSGDVSGGQLLMAPDPGDYPQPPARIHIGGEVIGTRIDLVSSSLGRPCDSPAALRPRLTFHTLKDPIGEARFLKVDLEALSGATIQGGEYFFDDNETFGTISSVLGATVTYHKANHYDAPGMPTGPAARIGTIGTDADNVRSNLHLEGGWIGLGPATSSIDQLRIDESGPNSCGFGLSAIDVNDSQGFTLNVGDLVYGAGAGTINPGNSLGVEGTVLNIQRSLSAHPMGNYSNFASMRIGTLRFLANSQLDAPDFMLPEPIIFPPSALNISVQVGIENQSRVDLNDWDCSGVTIQTERNPEHIGLGPVTILLEAHNTDWGPHWFCVADGSGSLDPRIRAWRELTVASGTILRLVDHNNTGNGAPNDEHGAAATVHPNEAVFISGQIKVKSGAVLDLNRLNLYTLVTPSIQGTVINGSIQVINPLPFGTFDGDNDVDDVDLLIITGAYSGPGVPTVNTLCDYDGDVDVDDVDIARFMELYEPGAPAVCGRAKSERVGGVTQAVQPQLTARYDGALDQITLIGVEEGPYSITLVDAAGRVVVQEAGVAQVQHDVHIHKGSLMPGVYVARVESTGGVTSARFLVD